MKGAFDFDPSECDYGIATLSVRQILVEWQNIDWFVTPQDAVNRARAVRLLVEHNTLARAAAPSLFPAHVGVRVERGSWDEFATLKRRVQAPVSKWDWKYGALKKLSSNHSTACGWSPHDSARDPTTTDLPSTRGELFFRIGDQVIWNPMSPKLDLATTLSPAAVEDAHWYLGYTSIDLTECFSWQLAEKSNDLGRNPFVPILRLYALGYYPFALAPEEFVLFGFAR